MKVQIGEGEELYDVIDAQGPSGEQVILARGDGAKPIGEVNLPLPVDFVDEEGVGKPPEAHVRIQLCGDTLRTSVVYSEEIPDSLLSRLEYAWYLVKDREVVERCWYKAETKHEWVLDAPGRYGIRVFAREKASGKSESVTTPSVVFPPSIQEIVLSQASLDSYAQIQGIRETLRGWLVACLGAGGDPFREASLSADGRLAVWTTSDVGLEFARAAYYIKYWVDVIGGPVPHFESRHLIPVAVATGIDNPRRPFYKKILALDVPWSDVQAAVEKYPDTSFVAMLPLLQAEFNRVAVIDPLNAFSAQHPHVKILICNRFTAQDAGELSKHEKNLKDFSSQFFASEEGQVEDPVWAPLGYSKDHVLEVITGPQIRSAGGVSHLGDRTGKYYNVVEGFRVTTDTPDHPSRSVWMFGSSVMRGAGADDAHTIPSELQRLCTEENVAWEVVNCANYSASNDEQQLRVLNTLPIQEDDICIFMVNRDGLFKALSASFTPCDLTTVFRRPHSMGEVFWSQGHINAVGNRAVAQKILETMKKAGWFDEDVVVPCTVQEPPKDAPTSSTAGQHDDSFSLTPPELSDCELEELGAYIEDTRAVLPEVVGVRGAIVMNCNPFTLGHRYLAEYAASHVDDLVLFVRQEDSSFLPFQERLALVREGVVGLPNVHIVPSGSFIVSQRTFAAYSNKESLQDRIVDPSLDVTIFADHIAPALGITRRFVGEEPLDAVTRQYNATMRRILPSRKIEFVIIPRKTESGEPISASKVRALLQTGDFNAISRLVPKSTLDYLEKRFDPTCKINPQQSGH